MGTLNQLMMSAFLINGQATLPSSPTDSTNARTLSVLISWLAHVAATFGSPLSSQCTHCSGFPLIPPFALTVSTAIWAMYCNCGNVAMFAEIGYIEPMTTGAPFRFDAVAAELAAADVADADGADVLELLLEQAEAAAASARQAKPAAKRGHFFVAIILSPPYAELRHTCAIRTLIVEDYFRALYSPDVRTSMGSGHSSPRY